MMQRPVLLHVPMLLMVSIAVAIILRGVLNEVIEGLGGKSTAATANGIKTPDRLRNKETTGEGC